ncbi:hypothetical protein SOM08_15990 [Hydrogenophaga sp. SNF1]|uniref:hypothetical protein n=1 Tax=Hydrogenophaga sp. SNF1 TaxID=3098762 RepID=UPI002ACC03E6|nr:hypothetical protein [Hydrogenophaga sp. SNF1]WQB82490.1 hypothetical protein SOM08_15990 [Hydrogenophaga sp. SNF1]
MIPKTTGTRFPALAHNPNSRRPPEVPPRGSSQGVMERTRPVETPAASSHTAPPGDPRVFADHHQPPVNLNASNLAFEGPAPGENPFDWLDKDRGTGRYAGFTADGQAVPRIFGPTDSPTPLSQGPAAGGPGPATPPETPNPFFDIPDAGIPPNLHPTPSAAPSVTPSVVDKAQLQIEQQTQLGLFCLGMHELVLRECVKQGLSPDAVKPLLDLFFDQGIDALKETQKIGASAGLLDSAAAPLDIQALKASALARRADATKQAELTRLKLDKEQSAPHDSPTFDPLTRRNGRKASSLEHSEMEESDSRSIKSQPSDGDATISGSGKQIPRSLRTDDPDTDGGSSSDEDGADSSAEVSATDSQKTIEMSVTEDAVPAPQPKASPQPLANQQQRKGATPQPVLSPPAKPQQRSQPVPSRPVKPRNQKADDRLAQQETYRQHDLARAAEQKKSQLRGNLMAEQTTAIADLERQLARITDPQAQRSLLSMSKDLQYQRHTQAVKEWSSLLPKKTAGAATADELARMDELDIISTAALDHEKAIKAVAAKRGIAL